MGAKHLPTLHFLKCLLMSKACLHGTSRLFPTHRRPSPSSGSSVPEPRVPPGVLSRGHCTCCGTGVLSNHCHVVLPPGRAALLAGWGVGRLHRGDRRITVHLPTSLGGEASLTWPGDESSDSLPLTGTCPPSATAPGVCSWSTRGTE